MIVQTSEMAGLEKAGLVKAGTVKPLGRVDIAVGVKAGAPHADISTYPKFRDALLAAGAVAYTDPQIGQRRQADRSRYRQARICQSQAVFNGRVATGEVPIWLEAAVRSCAGAYGVDEIGLVPASLNAYLQFSIARPAPTQSRRKRRWHSKTTCCRSSSAPV